MLKSTARLIVLLLTSAIALPAAADDFFMPGMSPMDIAAPYNAAESARIQGLVIQGLVEKKSRRSPTTSSGSSRPSNRLPANGATQGAIDLSYQPSAAVKQQVERNYLDRIRRNNPAAADQIAAQLRRYNYQEIYANLVQSYGLSSNNVADISTAYWVLNWVIANQSATDPSRQAVMAERDRTAVTLSKLSSLRNPQTRQQVGEEIKLLFVTLHAGWQSARREGQLSQYSDGVRAVFRQQNGADLRQIVLTKDGFQPRS